MNPDALIHSLESFAEVLPAAVAGVSDADARVKPASGAWSILEIVCHLLDEEVEDFRPRLRLTLERPHAEWPPIDPEGAARARRYNEQNLAERVHRWVNERRASIVWLRALTTPDWAREHLHPKLGPIPAGMLLAGWAAHDMLHLRQIAKRRFELVARDGAPYSTVYAGDWGP
jgi:hypothetical protein